MSTRTAPRCLFFHVWCILLFAAPSSGNEQYSYFSSACNDYNYGDPWTLKEIVSLAATSRVTCASLCMRTAECRGYSLDAGVCLLLRVEEALGGLVGCESRTKFNGTTYLVSVVHNEPSEELGQCPYFSEWTPTGRDDGEGKWRAGKCVCPNGKRGVFCNFGYKKLVQLLQNFNTTRSYGVQHVHINGADYLVEISLDTYDHTDPVSNAAIFRHTYRPVVYRYDPKTQSYEFLQQLDEQDTPNGSASFTAAGKHYVVVHTKMYVFNATTGFFDLYLTLDVKVAHVSALKRRSGEVVVAFADNSHTDANSLTLFWRPGLDMRKEYLPAPWCWTLKLFEVGSELYAGAASAKNDDGELVPSSVWRWNGTQWEMSQTLEQTICSGYGLDVATWNDVIYLAVTCHTPEVTQVYTRRANDETFSFASTLTDKGNYRPCFFSTGGSFFLAVPNFSLVKDAFMKIYQLLDGVFRTRYELRSHSSYSVTVFEQHHDVYMFIARRLKLDIWQDGATVEEHLSWSPLFKFV